MLSVRPFTSSKSGLRGIFGDPFDEPKKKKKPVVPSPGVFQRLLSGLGSGLEIIDRPRRSVQEGVAELLGVGDKKVGGADILLHGKTGTTGRELVDKAFGELNPKKTPWYNPGNLARAAGGFGLDVLLDPLTYAGVGLVGKTSLAGKAAIKELAEEVGEKAARKIVMETIEKGGRELGEKAGIRAFGKTVIPMSKIAKGSEFLGLSRAGRGIKNSGIGQAIGKRLMPGFMPKEIAENLPPEYADLWGEAHDFIKAMGRQKELRTSRVVEAVRRRAAPFSDDELRTALRVIENPRLGKGLRESGQLSDELVDYIRQVKKETKGAAFVEQKAGVLGGGLRKNYVKHLLSEAIPGGRKMASALPREYTGTVADVNAAAGRDLFEQILSVAHGTRMAESTRKLTNADMVDQFMKRFGAEIKPGSTIPAGWKVYKREGGRLAEIPRSIITEPHGFGSPSVVRQLGKETETVEKIKEVLPQILGLEDASPELLGLEKVGRGDLAGLPWMNKEVQSKVKQVVKNMTDEEAEKFTKELASYRLLPEQFADLAKGFVEKDKLDDLSGLWRKGHALWKSQVYGLRPGAQGRNFLWNNIVSGIAGMRNPGRLAQAVDVVSGRPGILKTKLGEEIPYEQIKKWAQEFGVEGHGFYGADIPEKVLNMLGRGKKSAVLNPLDLNNPIYRGARKFGTGVENNARYGLFIDQLAKGETPEQAARIVNKHLFDYSDLTQFDQQAKQAIPFYTFTKKNMALQPKLALEHPGIYAALPKGKEAVESLSPEPNEEFLPDYLKRNASIRTPFQQGKNPLYWLANLGFEDLKKPLSPNDLFSMLSPAIKIPTELMTNKNIYFDSPIEKTPGRPVGAPEFTADLPAPLKKLLGVSKGSEGYYEGKDVMSAKTRYLLEQIPLERDLTRILANTETSPLSLLAFLTGARLTPYDEKLAEQFGTGKFPRKKKAEPFKIGGKVFSGKGIF